MLNYLEHISAIHELKWSNLVDVAVGVDISTAIARSIAGETRGYWDRLYIGLAIGRTYGRYH